MYISWIEYVLLFEKVYDASHSKKLIHTFPQRKYKLSLFQIFPSNTEDGIEERTNPFSFDRISFGSSNFSLSSLFPPPPGNVNHLTATAIAMAVAVGRGGDSIYLPY